MVSQLQKVDSRLLLAPGCINNTPKPILLNTPYYQSLYQGQFKGATQQKLAPAHHWHPELPLWAASGTWSCVAAHHSALPLMGWV